MNSQNSSPPESVSFHKKISFKLRTAIVVAELIFVAVLLVLWLSSDSIQESTNLWALFFYNFPSHFLIAVVPHEPVLFYFGKFYSPVIVALVAAAGTFFTEYVNYNVFEYFADFKIFERIRNNKFTDKLIKLFNKAPFLALWVAGFTPVPFYPMRFLVVLAKYPVKRYLLAVLLSRTPRYYILALLGYVLKLPNYLLIIIFIFLAVIAYIPMIKGLMNKDKPEKE